MTATPELIEPCPKLQQYIHDIIQVVQKFLVVEYNEVYQKLVTTNVKTALADAKFYQVLTQSSSILRIQKRPAEYG